MRIADDSVRAHATRKRSEVDREGALLVDPIEGVTEAVVIDLPTTLYDDECPDSFDLPWDREAARPLVPYSRQPRQVPVEPNPPSARPVAGRSAATVNAARATGATTSWAMRSPRRIVNGASPRFPRITFTSPR